MFDQILEFSTNHPVLMVSFAAITGFILFTEYRNVTAKFTSLGPSAAISIINQDDSVLLDVRENNEIADGMLADAIHIPLSNIGKRLSEMDKHKDKSVVVYCRSGNRSTGVCRTLTGKGFDKVYNLSGGIMAWQDAHLPVSKKNNKKK